MPQMIRVSGAYRSISDTARAGGKVTRFGRRSKPSAPRPPRKGKPRYARP